MRRSETRTAGLRPERHGRGNAISRRFLASLSAAHVGEMARPQMEEAHADPRQESLVSPLVGLLYLWRSRTPEMARLFNPHAYDS
jgi:hypothetical protein